MAKSIPAYRLEGGENVSIAPQVARGVWDERSDRTEVVRTSCSLALVGWDNVCEGWDGA